MPLSLTRTAPFGMCSARSREGWSVTGRGERARMVRARRAAREGVGGGRGGGGGERGAEIAAGREKEGGGLFPAVPRQGGSAGEILALFGDNSGQDVRNGACHRCAFHGIRVGG